MVGFSAGRPFHDDMESLTDAELLAEWIAHRSQAAFALLVRRHISLVHSAARRQVNDPHLAEEITQAVFVLLASKAESLGRNVVLAGWLCRTAHFVARDKQRSERRRKQREHLAARMETNSDPAADAVWQQLAPHLDEAVAQLGEADRAAIVLRFYEQRPLDQIGITFGVGADAAQKRVARALDKLRAIFTGKGVSLTAPAMASAITANAVQIAPAGLAAQVSAGAIVAGTSVTATTLLSMSVLHKTIISVTVAAAVGTATHQTMQASANRHEARAMREANSIRQKQIQLLASERDKAADRLAKLGLENKLLGSQIASLQTTTQFEVSPRDNSAEALLKTWQARVAELKQHLEQNPAARIPEIKLLNESDWLMMVKERPGISTETDLQRVFSQIRDAAEEKFVPQIKKALAAFQRTQNGQPLTDFAQLLPYFDPQTDPEIFQRWKVVPAKTFPSSFEIGSDYVVTQMFGVVDEEVDRVKIFTSGQGIVTSFAGLKPAWGDGAGVRSLSEGISRPNSQASFRLPAFCRDTGTESPASSNHRGLLRSIDASIDL